MIASARRRGAVLGEKPAVPRISDLGHLYSSSLGKLEIDLMSSHQMSERQVLDAVIAEAVKSVFAEYVEQHGLEAISQIFAKGVKIEVGDMLPSEHYETSVEASPADLGQSLRTQRFGEFRGQSILRRVCPCGSLRDRPHQSCSASWSGHVRDRISKCEYDDGRTDRAERVKSVLLRPKQYRGTFSTIGLYARALNVIAGTQQEQ
jgi:hypothetical protein